MPEFFFVHPVLKAVHQNVSGWCGQEGGSSQLLAAGGVDVPCENGCCILCSCVRHTAVAVELPATDRRTLCVPAPRFPFLNQPPPALQDALNASTSALRSVLKEPARSEAAGKSAYRFREFGELINGGPPRGLCAAAAARRLPPARIAFSALFAGYADGKELPPGALLLRVCCRLARACRLCGKRGQAFERRREALCVSAPLPRARGVSALCVTGSFLHLPPALLSPIPPPRARS